MVKACKDAALIHLQSLLKLESTPFTQNGHYLSEKTAKTLARFKDARSGKDAMLDEIRRFQARKQTGAPSKRPQDASGSSASASPFDFSGLGTGTGTSTMKTSFAGFSGTWSSSTPARQTSPATPAQKTPQAQSAFGLASLPPKPDDTQRGFFGRTSPATAQPAQGAALLSTPTPAARPAVSPLAGTVQSQLGPAAQSIAELEAATEREALETEALALLTKLGYKGLKVEDLGKLNPPDEFEEELQVMAEVRAYFHVAYKVSQVSSLKFVIITDRDRSLPPAYHRLRSAVD